MASSSSRARRRAAAPARAPRMSVQRVVGKALAGGAICERLGRQAGAVNGWLTLPAGGLAPMAPPSPEAAGRPFALLPRGSRGWKRRRLLFHVLRRRGFEVLPQQNGQD